MKLVIHELEASGLTQSLTCEKNYLLSAVRPHIYRHNFPTGSLKIQVLDAGDVLVAESNEVAIADIGEDNFYHGFIRFDVSCGLEKDATYRIKLVGTGGYTFNESAYIGLANDYDLRKYDADYAEASGLRSPLAMEIWTLSPR